MKSDIFPICICAWCAFILGVVVIAASHDVLTVTVSTLCTGLALVIAITATNEYRQP